MSTPVTAAVVQMASVPTDPRVSAEKADAPLRAAATNDARLVVFPEARIGGHPEGASFGAPSGRRKPEGRAAFARHCPSAIYPDGPEVACLAEACAETVVSAVVGRHRKLMPTAGERLIWGFGDGSAMTVFQTDLGTIGAVICRENHTPTLGMHMYHQGVTLYCAPKAHDRDTWPPSMRHIALVGRCFVLTACQHITRAVFGPDHECAQGDEPDRVMMRGGSAIVSPLGRVVAGPDFGGRTILHARIDPVEAMRSKFDFDVSGHYARPDVFDLAEDTRARPAVREV